MSALLLLNWLDGMELPFPWLFRGSEVIGSCIKEQYSALVCYAQPIGIAGFTGVFGFSRKRQFSTENPRVVGSIPTLATIYK